MHNRFISNLKNVLLFILKSAVLIFICSRLIYVFLFVAMFVAIIYQYMFNFLGIQLGTWYPTGVTTQILQIIVFYFISKKLGIIKTFDKLPFWVLMFIAIIYEFVFLYQAVIGEYRLHDFLNHHFNYIGDFVKYSLQGYGYLYTFLFYSLKRFKVIDFILQLRRRR